MLPIKSPGLASGNHRGGILASRQQQTRSLLCSYNGAAPVLALLIFVVLVVALLAAAKKGRFESISPVEGGGRSFFSKQQKVKVNAAGVEFAVEPPKRVEQIEGYYPDFRREQAR